MEVKKIINLVAILCLGTALSKADSMGGTLKEKLKFNPSVWYFKASRDDDNCTSIAVNKPTLRTKYFYNCTGKPIGTMMCFCTTETLDGKPVYDPKKYTNACATCQVGFMPIYKHIDAFEDSLARKTVLRMVLGLTSSEWQNTYGRFRFMILPGSILKTAKAASILGSKTIDHLVKYGQPLVFEKDGSLNADFKLAFANLLGLKWEAVEIMLNKPLSIKKLALGKARKWLDYSARRVTTLVDQMIDEDRIVNPYAKFVLGNILGSKLESTAGKSMRRARKILRKRHRKMNQVIRKVKISVVNLVKALSDMLIGKDMWVVANREQLAYMLMNLSAAMERFGKST